MELGRLAQGNKYVVTPTDCIHFIPHSDVPSNTKVTYEHFIAAYRPFKPKPSRIRCVAGGENLIILEMLVHPPQNL